MNTPETIEAIETTETTLIQLFDSINNLKSTNKEKYNEITEMFQKFYYNSLYFEREQNFALTQARALNCFDNSEFKNNTELRKLVSDIEVLYFTKQNNGNDGNDGSITQNIVINLNKIKFEIIFFGKLRNNECRGSLNVVLEGPRHKITGTANNITYVAGQHLCFLVPKSMSKQSDQYLTKDISTCSSIENELYFSMNFNLTTKLMFCYFIDFMISDMVKQII